MDEELEPFFDETGRERRCGSLAPPPGFVSSFAPYESEKPLYSDAEIKKIITASGRVPRRQIFGASWVMDQKSHGSCNGFAGAGALAMARRLRGLNDNLLLSGAWLYSLINGNQDRGSMLDDGLKAIQQHGVAPASLVPWDIIYQRQMPANAKAEAAKHKGLVCYAVQTKQGFRSALAAGFPVIVAVHAGSAFQRMDRNGVVGVTPGRGNHACFTQDIAIIGGKECYDLQNSWGLQYADKGRAWVTWDSFEQTFESYVFYAIGSTEEAD